MKLLKFPPRDFHPLSRNFTFCIVPECPKFVVSQTVTSISGDSAANIECKMLVFAVYFKMNRMLSERNSKPICGPIMLFIQIIWSITIEGVLYIGVRMPSIQMPNITVCLRVYVDIINLFLIYLMSGPWIRVFHSNTLTLCVSHKCLETTLKCIYKYFYEIVCTAVVGQQTKVPTARRREKRQDARENTYNEIADQKWAAKSEETLDLLESGEYYERRTLRLLTHLLTYPK